MRDTWLKLVGSVLRPSRPRLEECRRGLETHLEAERSKAEWRARAIARCTAEIEATRAQVFAAEDGVVGARMTALEREWRTLSRLDRDGERMELWARIAPSSWLDTKRWRAVTAAAQHDAAVAMASDVSGIEAAEAAVEALRTALAGSGTDLPARVRWAWCAADFDGTPALLANALRTAVDALASRDFASVARERARALELDVEEAAHARLPERRDLSRALAHAAYVDSLWRAASLDARTNPATPLRALWATGYVLGAVGDEAVTLSLPGL